MKIDTFVLRSEDEKQQLKEEFVALEKNIPFFNSDVISDRSYICALCNGKVVGLIGFVESSVWARDAFGVGFISTHTEYRNKGVSTILVDRLFKLAEREGRNICTTPYEADGDKWVKHVVHRTALQYMGVILKER